jgi:hypothetical protein
VLTRSRGAPLDELSPAAMVSRRPLVEVDDPVDRLIEDEEAGSSSAVYAVRAGAEEAR